ncbi:arginine repressor [Pendulispora albinea]|uniref:Arginine repressor n=1 Tax=Pendulispora albinea TaxID=2741071 RepID=A0ABZ2LXE2_9BACT
MGPVRPNESLSRREAIRNLIRTEQIGTQEELRERIAELGFDVTQATLSRDLARLRARRVTLAGGGMVYEIEGFPATTAGDGDLERVRDMVTSVLAGDTLVVVHTLPGAASAVARALDGAKLPELLGTIAGDDTIFLAPAPRIPPANLVKRLISVWKKGMQ